MSAVDTSVWLLVFVAVLALGADGIRLAVVPLPCDGPMDRVTRTLFVVVAVCVVGIPLLPLGFTPV